MQYALIFYDFQLILAPMGYGEGKHHMDVRDVEQLCFAGGEPGGWGAAWTLRTMPIATGVLGDSPGAHTAHIRVACPPGAAVRHTAMARRARCCSGDTVAP